jgi:hypothetical protein
VPDEQGVEKHIQCPQAGKQMPLDFSNESLKSTTSALRYHVGATVRRGGVLDANSRNAVEHCLPVHTLTIQKSALHKHS